MISNFQVPNCVYDRDRKNYTADLTPFRSTWPIAFWGGCWYSEAIAKPEPHSEGAGDCERLRAARDRFDRGRQHRQTARCRDRSCGRIATSVWPERGRGDRD